MPRLLPFLAAGATLAAIVAPVTVFAQAPAASSASALTIGSTAPPMAVGEWVKGQPVKLGDGKLHVVEFWATWCGPCKVSIPHLTELAKKYAGKADFTGVSVWEVNRGADASTVPAKVKTFVDTMGTKMDYHVARDKDDVMAKTWMEAAAQDGIPTAFVVDKDGKIAWIGHPMGGLDEALGKIIAGKYDRAAAAQAMKTERDERAKEQAQQEKMNTLFCPVMALAKEKKFSEAVSTMDTILAANPDYVGPTAYLRYNLLLSYDEAAAQAYAVKMAGGEWKSNAGVLNAIAWGIVADDTKIKAPNYAAAVTLAEAAAAASGNKEPEILDTLAVAYDKHGDIDKAIDTEAKAVSLLKADADPAMVKDLKERLAGFKAKKK